MKVYCNALDLSAAVLKVVKATGTKNVNPILEGIKIIAQEDNLTLIATDGDLTIIKKIDADIKIEGQTVVPGKFFSEYVKRLTTGDVELALDENGKLKIKHSESESYVQCLPVNEYPEIRNINVKNTFSIRSRKLKSAIETIIFAIATDDARPVLKGALFEIIDNKLTVVAIDGYRMAKKETVINEASNNLKAIIPGRSLKEIANLLGENDDIIQINFDRNFTQVEVDNTVIISKILDGEFMNYNQLIRTEFSSVVTVDKALFENFLDQGSIVARAANDVRLELNIKENLMTMETKNQISAWSATIPIVLEGNDIKLAFNINYVKDCVRGVKNDTIQFNMQGQFSACIIKSTDEDNEESVFLLLPIR